jgi:hypothetical protein
MLSVRLSFIVVMFTYSGRNITSFLSVTTPVSFVVKEIFLTFAVGFLIPSYEIFLLIIFLGVSSILMHLATVLTWVLLFLPLLWCSLHTWPLPPQCWRIPLRGICSQKVVFALRFSFEKHGTRNVKKTRLLLRVDEI